jgi:hypothetical protein
VTACDVADAGRQPFCLATSRADHRHLAARYGCGRLGRPGCPGFEQSVI